MVTALLLISLAGDIISYLHHAPTVIAVEKALGGLWRWLFRYEGLAMAVVVLLAIAVLLKVRKRLGGVTSDEE
jgi:hypothetical protein